MQGNNRCLFSDQYETCKYTVWAESGFFCEVIPGGTCSDHWALKSYISVIRNQSANAVQGNNRCLFSDQYVTCKYTVWEESGFFVKLYLVVHILTTKLEAS